MERLLTWLNRVMPQVYDDPDLVPGNTWEEKVHHLLLEITPSHYTVKVTGRWDLRHVRTYHIEFEQVA